MKIISKINSFAQGVSNFGKKQIGIIQKKRLEKIALKTQPRTDVFVSKKDENKKLIKAIFSGLKDIGIQPLQKSPYVSSSDRFADYVVINGKYFDAIDFMLALGYKSNETDKIISNIAQLSEKGDSVKVCGHVTRYAPLNTQLFDVFNKLQTTKK